MQFVSVVLAPVAMVALLLLAVLSLRGRRSVYKPDPDGVRTMAVLHGPLTTADDEDLAIAGEAQIGELGASLSQSGFIPREVHLESYGWVAMFDVDGVRHQLTFGARDRTEWVAGLVSAGAAVSPSLLEALDRGLRAVAGATHVTWHPRELFLRGDESSFDAPLGRP